MGILGKFQLKMRKIDNKISKIKYQIWDQVYQSDQVYIHSRVRQFSQDSLWNQIWKQVRKKVEDQIWDPILMVIYHKLNK